VGLGGGGAARGAREARSVPQFTNCSDTPVDRRSPRCDLTVPSLHLEESVDGLEQGLLRSRRRCSEIVELSFFPSLERNST